MKARVKSTGVLIDVIPKCNANAQHSGDNLYVCDNMIFRGCDLDFLNIGNSIDWEQRRYEIAKEVLSGILIWIAYSGEDSYCTENCKHAVKYAKERFEAASIRLYELLTAQKVIKELEKRYRSLKSIIMEIKNGIIIDGVLHDLIRTEYHDCKTCSLCSICYKNLLIDKLCDIKVQKGISYKFVNQGKVTNIKIDKED